MSERYISILTTKLAPPRLGRDRILRQELIEKLNKAQSCSLCLVMGPAGYGKSTLLAQWRELLLNNGHACGWLTLDVEDNAIGQFLRYLCAAIKRMAPGLAVQIEDAEESFLYHPKQLIITIINALAESDGNYDLFLDDYNEISDREVHDTVQFLLEQLPGNVNVYIGSRHVPNLSIEKLKLQQLVYLLGSESLRFNQQELSEFLTKTQSITLSDDEMARFFAKTQGWPAAVMLASQMLNDSDKRQKFLNADDSEVSFGELLVAEVLNGLSEKTLNSLLKISITERFCEALAIELTDDKDIADVIGGPQSGSFLLQRFDDDDTWYYFHPLVRSYLRNRLNQQFSGQVPRLHLIASNWFEQHLWVREAVNHAYEAQDENRVYSIIEVHANSLIQQGFSSLLISLVKRLSFKSAVGAERILVPIAWAQTLSYNFDDARQLIQSIEEIINGQDEASTHLLVQLDTMRGVIGAYLDNLPECESITERWVGRIPKECAFEEAVMANLRCYGAINRFQFAKINQYQKQAQLAREQLSEHGATVYGLFVLGMAHARQAQLPEALAYYEQARELIQDGLGQVSIFRQFASLLIATIKYQLGEIDAARDLIEANIEAARLNGYPDLLFEVLPVMVRVYQYYGDLRKTNWAISLGQLMAQTRHSVRLQALMLYEKVRLDIRCNDIESARTLIENWPCDSLKKNSDDSLFIEQSSQYLKLASARVNIAMNQPKQALEILNSACDYFSDNNLVMFAIEAGLLRVEALVADQQAEAAKKQLLEIIGLTEYEQPIQIYLDHHCGLNKFLDSLANETSAGGVNQFVKQWVNLSQQQAAVSSDSDFSLMNPALTQPATVQALVEPLTSREISVLAIVADGMSNKQVSETLFISIETVKSHLKSIYSKMAVSRRTQAVNMGRDLKII